MADSFRQLEAENKRLREQLAQCQHALHLAERVAEATVEAIVFSEDGRVIDVNEQFTRMFGYRREEAIGMEVAAFQAPEERDRVLRAVKGQQEVVAEYRNVRKDGSVFQVEAHGRPTTYGGRTVRVTAIRDITERKRAEEALQERERELRFVCESIPHMVWAARPDGYIDYVNRRVLDYTGAKHEEFVGWGWLPFIHPEDRQQTVEVWTNALRDGVEVKHVYRLRHGQSGEYRWYAVHTLPLRDGDGRIIRWYGTCTDIDEQKRAEEALRQAMLDAQRFRQAVESVAVYVYMKDLQSRYLYANKPTLELFGCTAEELVGCDDARFFPPQTVKRLREVDLRVFAGEQTFEEIDVAHGPSRRRVYLEIKTPIYADLESKTICGLLGISTDITARKHAEERLEQRVRERTADLAKALAEAEEGRATLDALLESIPEGITIVEVADYRIRRASRYMAQALGVDMAALEGTTAAEYVKRWETFEADGVTPIGVEGFPVVQAMREGTTVQGRELVMRRAADGAKVPILSNAAPIRDSSGRITGGIGAWREITDRKQAEEALRASNERLKKVLEVETVGVMFWDLTTGRMTDANDAFLKMMGYSRSEVKAGELTWQNLTPPESMEASLAEIKKFQATGRVGPYEKEYLRKDGTRQWFVFAGSSLGNNTCVEFCVDIADRKRAEEALRESEQRLKLAQQAAGIGAFEWNVQTGVNTWTPELEAMYGLAPGQFAKTQTAWEQLVHPEDRAAALGWADQAFATGEPGEKEWRVIWPDGSVHWIMGRFQASKDATGKPLRLTGVNIDITDRKQAEAALRQLNETLEQRVAERTEALRVAKADAEKANAAKDHFLAVLSHELRNPLAPVLPALAAMEKLVPKEGGEFLEIARRNVELEARLIDDLLDVTRIARGKIELDCRVVELGTILHRAAEVCRADIEARRLHFGIEIEDGPHPVHVDPARLQQVFWNLIKNAVKFTPHGGCVGVRCWREKGQAMVEVTDSGEGIAPEALSRVFNAFEQESHSTTRQFGGLGLGLAISKALVEMHGGTIQVHSAGKNKGATFTVALPIAELRPMEKPTAPAAEAEQPIPARALRILLVEDHGDTARIMGRLLTAEGHSVKHAGDVARALELAGGEEFDALVSDLGLPDGSGHDLMRQLVARGKRLPGIALSGYGMAADVQKSREAGFLEHLIKPVSFDALMAAVGRVANAVPA